MIDSHYTELDWRRKSEEARLARVRRVKEWEKQNAGVPTHGKTRLVREKLGDKIVNYKGSMHASAKIFLKSQSRSEPSLVHVDKKLYRRALSMDVLYWE